MDDLIHLIEILMTENCHDEIRVEALREIRKILEEKPKVTRGFVQKWLEEKWHEDWCDPSYYEVLLSWLMDLLKEAGAEVEE